MNKPFFSIILPTHNGEDRVDKAIHSVLSQSFQDYELIVVCDSCTDRTSSIVESYADSRIYTIYTKVHNDGLARNHGIDYARGEWILFLDDDDWYLHEYCLQQLADVVGKNNEDILMFSFIITGQRYYRQSPEEYFTACWAHCWRRTFIEDQRFTGLPYGSDTNFVTEQIAREPVIAFWDMPIYRYNYMREGSLSWNRVNGGGEHE
jgi:glycosyltransferase involved in cell wall biosynthesis